MWATVVSNNHTGWCQGRCALHWPMRGLQRNQLLSFCCAFFPGLSIGLKQFGIAPCIIPFSSIEWRRMERRYIWPFLLTWRLESCVVFSACDSDRTTGDSRLCVPEMDTCWTKGFSNPEGSERLLIFWEQGGKTYSQLIPLSQGITASQQIWSEKKWISLPFCASFYLSENLFEIGDCYDISPTSVADTGLALGFVCNTALFWGVSLFYAEEAFNNL